MGCDGGTIPRRDELVRLKKKPEQKDKDSELSFRWRHCAISQQPLQEPIVGCGLGRLYSKSALLEALLDKSTLPESSKHIKNLKDIKDLNLTPNPAFDPDNNRWSAPYVCPVIGLEMTGKFRFVFLWTCGCVFSERALKAVKTTVCHKCQKPFGEQDVIILNGSEEDIDLMTVRLDARQARAKADKKNKKSNKSMEIATSSKTEETSVTAVTATIDDPQPGSSNDKSKIIKNNMTQSKCNPPKSALNIKVIKRSAVGQSMSDPAFKKSKKDYSVAKDPKATDVFKSLFTSHNSEQTQERAHWVTYNPFYN